MNLSRRNFVKTSMIAFGGSFFAFSCKNSPKGAYYFFTQEEAACVIALCEQIIPADKDPGATDAGVIHFIDRQLIGFYKNQQETYRKGIEAIQKTCSKLNGSLFENIKFAEQTKFLKLMEKGKLPLDDWGEMKQEQFFGKLVDHTMQGFYGSPRHGGNKDYMSYTMMGLEYPLVVGQNRYKNSL